MVMSPTITSQIKNSLRTRRGLIGSSNILVGVPVNLLVSSYQLPFVYHEKVSHSMSTNLHVKLRNQIITLVCCKEDEETMRFPDKRADVYKARYLVKYSALLAEQKLCSLT